MGIDPDRLSICFPDERLEGPTSCDHDTKQPTYDPLYRRREFFVCSFRAVHCPVCVLAHAQAEKIRFADYEVEVLIVDLGYIFGCIGGCYSGSKLFEKRPGNRGKEIDVGGGVELR